MAVTVALRNAAAEGVRAVIDAISLHSADPGTTGASEVSRVTQAGLYAAASNGTIDLAADVTFDIDAGEAPAFWGLWDGVTFLGGVALTAAEGAYGSAGTYTLTSAPVPVAAG